MKASCLLILFILFFDSTLFSQNKAAYLDALGQYYTCGKIDITGNQLTVEALIKENGTGPYIGAMPHDIVSKHNGASDVNYLLRGDHCEITTTNGYFLTTPSPFSFVRDSFYHLAMTYDGVTLKYYVNGCLFQQAPASGDLVTNSYITTIGQLASQPGTINAEQFYGYIDEVRIWKVARTQSEIVNNMHDLASPATKSGLIAYYKFDGNSINVQGNTALDAVPHSGATIQAQDNFSRVKPFTASVSYTNPTLIGNNGSITVNAQGGKAPFSYSVDGTNYQSSNTFNSLSDGTYNVYVKADGLGCSSIFNVKLTSQSNNISPSFTAPDTVCVNTPVNIVNTSIGASSYYWNFCVADINKPPVGTNMGNLGQFSAPVYIDYVYDNGNYYGFLTNNYPGGLLRLNFGNSLLNTPTVTDFGTVGGVIPKNTEGIQVIKNEGKWYAIIVGGDPVAGSTPSAVVKVEFGTDITNNAPTAKYWGNVGNLSYPHDLYVFEDNGHWYGLTVNTGNSTITRFDFTTSFSNDPTGTNLGNIGNLNSPTGVYAYKENGLWYAFVTNATSSTLSKLSFGNSLLNVPTGSNLGNIDNKFHTCWDIYIMKFCGETLGFVINADQSYSDIIKLDFHGDASTVPTATSLGNQGNMNFPHCISKLFRVGSDLYSFVPNVGNNTLTRLQFTGCTNASVPNTSAQNPPSITYNTPGVYNINLTIDDGLPSQSAYCKQVVVMGAPLHLPMKDLSICTGDSIKIGTSVKNAIYTWNLGNTKDSVIIHDAGNYWVESNRYGCINRDSFAIKLNPVPFIQIRNDTAICKGDSLTLKTNSAGSYTYSWFPSKNLSDPTNDHPIASPVSTTQYILSATNSNGCKSGDTVNITVKNVPIAFLGKDTAICKGDSIVLKSDNPGANYLWQDATSTETYTVNSEGDYRLKVDLNGCTSSDTIHISLNPDPVFKLQPDTSVCRGTKLTLRANANESYSYSWFPSAGLSNPSSDSPDVTVSESIKYYATATNSYHCTAKDSLTVLSLELPSLELGNDTLICTGENIVLDAQNQGATYLWSNGETTETTQVNKPGKYFVMVTNNDGCSNIDSISIGLKSQGSFNIQPSVSNICKNDTLVISASGGDQYEWFTTDGSLNISDSSITLIPFQSETFYVKVTDRVCHEIETLQSQVIIKPGPNITITKSNDITCNTPVAQLSATGGISYKWYPPLSISNINVPNPTVYPQNETWYSVTAKGGNGCSSTDSILVEAHYDGIGNFYIPNAFTPNNDGKNDCFGVKYWGTAKNFELSIYNRWGERVFHSNDILDCWNGYYKGVLQPNDVFVYYIKVEGPCGRASKSGTLTLIR